MTITIGSQTNVPDPGSPITSPWPQDTARKLVHQFATVALRNAWGTRPQGAMAFTVDNNVLAVWNGSVWHEIGYQDGVDAKVSKSGDSMSGPLTVNGTIQTGSGDGIASTGISTQVNGRINTLQNTGGQPNLYCDRVVSGASAAGEKYVLFQRIGTNIGSISIATATSVGFNTTSDPRLKQVTDDVPDAADLAQALGHAVFRGRWIDPATDLPEVGGAEWIMASSHDVQDVAPFAVTGERDAVDDDGHIVPQQVNYPALVPLLFAALAQAIDRIDALEGGTTT